MSKTKDATIREKRRRRRDTLEELCRKESLGADDTAKCGICSGELIPGRSVCPFCGKNQEALSMSENEQ